MKFSHLEQIIACLKCKSEIVLNAAKDNFICSKCGVKNKFKDNISIILTEKEKL